MRIILFGFWVERNCPRITKYPLFFYFTSITILQLYYRIQQKLLKKIKIKKGSADIRIFFSSAYYILTGDASATDGTVLLTGKPTHKRARLICVSSYDPGRRMKIQLFACSLTMCKWAPQV
jgi:hypothetical protein